MTNATITRSISALTAVPLFLNPYLVMWDNTGMLHRALPFEPTSRRLMHRTTLVGEEAVSAAAASSGAGTV